jgi:hypothetical protein
MMLTISGIAILTGAALGLRFNVLILVLTIGAAILGAGVVGMAHGEGTGFVALTIVIVGSALQFGFVTGIVARAVFASNQIPNADLPQNFAYGEGQQRVSMFKSLDVQDHMEVVGSDGEHVGIVDHKESADRIILTKDDPNAGGRPHLISIKWVDYVDRKVHLNKPSNKAMTEWKVAA